MKKENGNIIVDTNFAIGNQDTVSKIAFIIAKHYDRKLKKLFFQNFKKRM